MRLLGDIGRERVGDSSVNSRTRADLHLEHIKAVSLHCSSNSVYFEQFTFPFPPRPISLLSVGAKGSYMEIKTFIQGLRGTLQTFYCS